MQDNINTNTPPVFNNSVLNIPIDNNFSGLGNGNNVSPKSLNIEPSNLTGRQLLGKTIIGLFVGSVISGLLFILMTFIGSMFTDAMQQNQSNPLLPLIFLFIGFIGSFVGNLIIAGLYNLFYSKKYYNSSKTFAFVLLTNGILFFILAPLYLVFSKDINTLFIILAFHMLFAVFVSANQIEFTSNPNYSGSALMGNILGFTGAILLYMLIYKFSKVSGSVQQQTYLLVLLPSIFAFTLIPLGSGIWDKIYYKMYEMGSNVFYIPSLSEVVVGNDEESIKDKNDEIHVDMN